MKKFYITAVIFFASYFVFFIYSQPRPHEPVVEVTFFDIGQGDATFVEFPNGEQMLIDCSIDARVLESLGRVMPFDDRVIDYLVVTHPDLDHYGGCIDVFKRFTVHHKIYTGYLKEENSYFKIFFDEIKDGNGIYHVMDSQEIWTVGATTVSFLWPDHSVDGQDENNQAMSANNASIVIKLSYGESDVLLMGDTEKETEDALLDYFADRLPSDVIKVGHHGSDSSSQTDFLDAIGAKEAVISSGKENRYGHPSARVLKRLERIGSRIWRTDQMGDILVRMTHETVYVEAKKY